MNQVIGDCRLPPASARRVTSAGYGEASPKPLRGEGGNADWGSRLRFALTAFVFSLVGVGAHAGVVAMQTPEPGGIVIEHDAEVARNEPGTHNGGGQTVGYSFFRSVPNLKLVFRKRAFKPGSGVGHHVQKEDEIYYVLSGTGTMTLDGKTVDIKPGTAVLTRPGSSHSLKQTGTEELVVLINYEVQPRPAPAK